MRSHQNYYTFDFRKTNVIFVFSTLENLGKITFLPLHHLAFGCWGALKRPVPRRGSPGFSCYIFIPDAYMTANPDTVGYSIEFSTRLHHNITDSPLTPV